MPERSGPTDPTAPGRPTPDPPAPGRLVHAAAFADPGLTRAGDRWWAVAGTGPAGIAPTLSSIDLVHWQREPDVLGRLGDWAAPGSFRSPELLEVTPGHWLLFHSASRADDGSPAVGVATATDPGGVFVDALGAPLVGSATDPSVLTADDGTRWLYWTDVDDRGRPGGIRGGRLSADGLALADPEPTTVLTADRPWQAGSVTAAQVVATASGLLMVYQAGRPDTADRCLAVARAFDPTDPFVADGEPLFVSGARYDGPGHPAVVTDPGGRIWLLFTAWPAGRAGTPGAREQLWLAALDVSGDRAVVSDPVPAPGPLPAAVGRWRLPVPDDPSPAQERVLRAFTVHGAIRAVPARHHLRVVLLDLLAQLFEPGVRYPEPEVDRRLAGVWAPGVHPDYARLRRLLVDQQFLDRRGGIYRRSGGTV